MRQGCFGLLALTAMLWNSPAAEAEWLYKTIQGSSGKTRISFASHRFGGAANTYTIVVRCQGSVLDAYVDFKEYLGANLRPVRLKVDKEAAVQEHWWPSKSGTAVFAEMPSEFARALVRGARAKLEVVNDRGARHAIEIALRGSARAIRPVLKDCGVSEKARHLEMEGVRRDVALDIERLGPKQTSAVKGALKQLGFYEAEENTEKDDALYLGMTRFFETYLARCKAGEELGISCDDMRLVAKGGLEPMPPAPSRALAEVAPAPYRHYLITLKTGQ